MSSAPQMEPMKIEFIRKPKASRERQSVVFELQVVGVTDASRGTVSLLDGCKRLGIAQPNDSGKASVTLSGLKWGVHSISASYLEGDQVKVTSAPVEYKVKRTWEDHQHLLTVIALWVGAVWGLFVWVTTWIDHLETEGPALQVKRTDVTISPVTPNSQDSQQSENAKKEFVIRGKITVTNVGNKRTDIPLVPGPLFIARVKSIPAGALKNVSDPKSESAKDGKMGFCESRKFWLPRPLVDDPKRTETVDKDQLRPQESDEFNFIIKVGNPGLYALMFSPLVSDKEQGSFGSLTGLPYKPGWESSPVFVEVEEKGLKPSESGVKYLNGSGCDSLGF